MSIDATGWASGAINISLAIPATWTQFWDEIDSSGNELRAVDADGVTKLVYDLNGFNKTNRTGTIRIGGYTPGGAGILHLFAYWNATGAASGAGAPAVTSPYTGYIEQCIPAYRVDCRPARPGDLRPGTRVQKGSDETIQVAFDFRPLLRRRAVPANGHYDCDEARWMSYSITTAGSAQASMITAANSRIVAGGLVLVDVKGGADGTDYTITPVLRTWDGAVLSQRAWLLVRDQDEA